MHTSALFCYSNSGITGVLLLHKCSRSCVGVSALLSCRSFTASAVIRAAANEDPLSVRLPPLKVAMGMSLPTANTSAQESLWENSDTDTPFAARDPTAKTVS